MGDTISVNVLKEAIDNKKKCCCFGTKRFHFCLPNRITRIEQLYLSLERNTIVIGASCDTAEVHFAWLNTAKDDGGIEGVTYNLLADSNRNLAGTLGILDTTNERYDEETGTVLWTETMFLTVRLTLSMKKV